MVQVHVDLISSTRGLDLASPVRASIVNPPRELVAPETQLAKDRLSDAGGLRFESQTGLVTGKSIRILWRDTHPAIKGLRPPEHHAGQCHPDRNKTPTSQTKKRVRYLHELPKAPAADMSEKARELQSKRTIVALDDLLEGKEARGRRCCHHRHH